MAYAMTKQGSLDNCVTYEFICDAVEDMNAIEDRYRTIGTVAIVLSGASGLEVYIAGSDKQWNSLSGVGTAVSAGLSIHICGQNEVENGLPNVREPDDTTIYLVPANDSSSGNLYDEYIYVAEAWEKFGSGGVSNNLPITYEEATTLEFEDVVIADINNPPQSQKEYMAIMNSIIIEDSTKLTNGAGVLQVGDNKYQIVIVDQGGGQIYGSTDVDADTPEALFQISISQESTKNVPAMLIVADSNNTPNETYPVRIQFGRPTLYVANTQERIITEFNPKFTGSISMGRASNTIVGESSIAEGEDVEASGYSSHAEGHGTVASGSESHAEGFATTASGASSHAEGYDTIASGADSHAEGAETIALGEDSHVSGSYNIADSYDNWPEWVANTSYNVGDKVKRTTGSGVNQQVYGYICKTANSDSTFTVSKWNSQYGKMNYAEIIGNGTASDARSNARVLDWDGNEHLMGDIYVGCNANSTGGTKLPRIPEAPSTDGTYILQAIVTNGIPTYSWISAG